MNALKEEASPPKSKDPAWQPGPCTISENLSSNDTLLVGLGQVSRSQF